MNKHFKGLFCVVLSLVACLCLAGLFACSTENEPSGNDTDDGKTYYEIAIEDSEHGSVTADRDTAEEGATVTLTVKADEGYYLDVLTVNGTETTVTGDKATFTMPANNVNVKAEFLKDNTFRVNIETTAHVTVVADKTVAETGDTVNLTVTVDEHYKLASLLMNSTSLTVEDGKASFVMPAQKVVISATVALSEEVSQEAAGDGFEISARIGNKTALSVWNTAYGETALEFSVFVEDEELTEGDGIYMFLGRSGYEFVNLRSGINYGLYFYPYGMQAQLVGTNGGFATADSENLPFTTSWALWSNDGKNVSGYVLKISITYATLGYEGQPEDGQITVLPCLFNKNATGSATGYFNNEIYDNAYYPGSYHVLKNKTLTQNYFANGINLGGTAKLAAQGNWDLSKDYYAEDERYAQREVTLNGVDSQGSLLFFREQGNTLYAKATIKYNCNFNNDQLSKFGLMLYDEGYEQGVFFYVDANIAAMNANRNTGVGFNASLYGSFGDVGYYDIFNEYDFGYKGQFDGTTKKTVLELSYYNNILSFYMDGKLIHQIGYAAIGTPVIGIKSFNCGVTVTDYSVTSNEAEVAAHSPEFATKNDENVVLFAGDSYMHFIKLYGVWDSITQDITGAGDNTDDIGLGGSKVNYWSNDGRIAEIKARYSSVAKIAIHIGVNDIDANKTPQETYNELVTMFTRYHAAFPATEIYWVSIIPNNFKIKDNGTDWYNEEYHELNVLVKEYAKKFEWLTYVDVETPFTDADGSYRQNFFMSDGLHLNPVYGYPLWTRVIKEAMGYPALGNESLGDAQQGSFAATAGWTYGGADDDNLAWISKDKVYNSTVLTEEATYAKGLYGADILFEAEIKSSDRFYDGNEYSKVGVMLANSEVTIFAFFDTGVDAGHGTSVTKAWMMFRANYFNNSATSVSAGVGDWDYSRLSGGTFTQTPVNLTQTYAKIAIAKLGNTVYLLVDGNIVAKNSNIPFVTAQSQFAAGVMMISRYAEVKNVTGSTDVDDIENTVNDIHDISVLPYDSVTIDISKESAYKGDSVTFTIDTEVQIEKVIATYNGQEHVLTPENGIYSFTMPHADVIISLVISGWHTITIAPESQDKITASSTSVEEGNRITFSAKENVYIVKLYADGVEIPKVDNVFVLTVTQDAVITGEYLYTEGGVVFDGILTAEEGWTDEVLSQKAVDYSNGARISVVGLNTAGGIRIGVIVDHNTPVTDRVKTEHNNWADWLNVEIRLNGNYDVAIQAGVLDDYMVNCRMTYHTVTGTGGYRYTTTFEILVSHGLFGTDENSAIGICVGGCQDGYFNWLFKDTLRNDNVPFMHHITKQGLMTLTGDFTNFAWTDEVKAKTYTHSVAGVNVAVMGTKTQTGVLVGVTVDHNRPITDVLQGAGNEWYHYQNIELRLNGDTGKQIALTSWNHGAAWCWFAYQTGAGSNGYNYRTSYEIFVPYYIITGDSSGDIAVCFGGVFDNGFTALFGQDGWTATHYLTDNGLETVAGDICTDGVLDEAVWSTAKGQASALMYHGSTVTEVRGYSNERGVVLALIATHTAPVTQPLKDGVVDWSYFLNYEVRFNSDLDVPIQFVALNYYRNNCVAGWQTQVNADGTYTTTFEVFIPHSVKGTNMNDPIYIVMGGVQSNAGFMWTWDFAKQYYITKDGLYPDHKQMVDTIDGVLDEEVWTDEVMSAEHTLEFDVTYASGIDSSKVYVNGVKVDGGVLFAVTMQHNAGIYQCTGDNVGNWEQYNNIRFNLFAVNHDVAVYSPQINGIVGWFYVACKTVDNGEGAEYRYTTVYEVFVPEGWYAGQDFSSGRIALTLVVTIDDPSLNFLGNPAGLKDQNWFAVCGYVTDNGMVAA